MQDNQKIEDKDILLTVRGFKKIIETAKEMAIEQGKWPLLEYEPEGWLELEAAIDGLMERAGLDTEAPSEDKAKPFRLCRSCTIGSMQPVGNANGTEILQCTKCKAVEIGGRK